MNTLTELLESIHRKVSKNVDYPTVGDDDYTLRVGLINDYIDEWNKEEGVNWNELWAKASFASTSAASYDLSASVSNMDFPGGFVELIDSSGGNTKWEVKKLGDIQSVDTSQGSWCYFMGDSNNGYTLYFNPNNHPGAGTIQFPYYKVATHLSGPTDTPEMSDPSYLIHMASSEVMQEDDPASASNEFSLGQSRLHAMKTRNITPPEWQSDRLQDKRGIGFGY